MTSHHFSGERAKVASKLRDDLRHRLKVRAAELRMDIQDATCDAITLWRRSPVQPPLDTRSARSFSTLVPALLWDGFEEECRRRRVSNIQGLSQAVNLWLRELGEETSVSLPPQRIISAMQKGGVGKTSTSAGLAQALAEAPEHGGMGLRVLLVDYDPQGDVTVWHGIERIKLQEDNSQHSLTKHMLGHAGGQSISDLLVTIDGDRFGGRLQLLPTCMDAFLLEASMGTVRFKEAALERALQPLEDEFDVIIIDCPPSLGLSMDAAVYYGRRRQGEPEGRSGLMMPVQAEDSSIEAYMLFDWQVSDLVNDAAITVDYLGFVVNLYDSRRGIIATSTLQQWQDVGDPPVLEVVADRKEQREQVRLKEPLLVLYPESEHAKSLRSLAKNLRKAA